MFFSPEGHKRVGHDLVTKTTLLDLSKPRVTRVRNGKDAESWYTGYCFPTICRDTAGHSEAVYLAQETFLEGLKGGNLEEAEVFTSTAPSPFISCLPCFWGADVSTVLDHINQPLGCLLGSQVSWPKGGLSSKSESRGVTGCRWGPNESCRGSWGVRDLTESASSALRTLQTGWVKNIFQIGPKNLLMDWLWMEWWMGKERNQGFGGWWCYLFRWGKLEGKILC